MMLHVVGGTYYELCAEPERRDFYGSGLRAAASISQLTPVTLHTYVDEVSRENLVANSNAFGVRLKVHTCAKTIRFYYAHPLATPLINPPIITPSESIQVSGDAVLYFGMLEGSARLKAKRAVYDPQSPVDPHPFTKADSDVEQLAIVCNVREASLLAGGTGKSLSDVGDRLLRKSGAAAVIIKRGAHGAEVYTPRQRSTVRAYKTERVWKIGSGDVFAAAFAFYWARQNMSPALAAERASAAAALYCGTHALPLPANFYERVTKIFKQIKIARQPKKPKPAVYLAGPFFTMAQRWLIRETRQALSQQGLDVFSPLHDVGHGSADEVVTADLYALKTSDAVFAIIDGIDAGTLFEVGYATSLKIPVIGFAQNEHSDALKMLEGSDCLLHDDFTTAIYHTAWAALSA